VSEYKKTKRLELISPYEPIKIYNADETGLFFQALPTELLAVKRENVPGVKCLKGNLQCYCV
jgi:hypothetical protein